MKYIRNKFIPFEGFKAITIWPVVFFKGSFPSKKIVRHEAIHGAQQKELFIIPFYIIYLIEILFVGYGNSAFEKEAYGNADDVNYLDTRKRFAMWRK